MSEMMIREIDDSLVPHTLHPFHALDVLYEEILLSIIPEIQHTTLRILSLCVHASPHGLFVQEAMAFLDIDRSTVDRALQNLHSVVNISSPGTDEECFHFFHHSFPDFLQDTKRSGWIAREINMEMVEGASTTQVPSGSGTTLDKGKGRAISESRLPCRGFPASGSGSMVE